MNNKLTIEEKKFLAMLFSMSKVVINATGGYFDIYDEASPDSYFSAADLFDLATKLGVEDMY